MLQGFTVPLTPQGNSPLASPPPWHYSSDCLAVEFWTDPAAIAALLPPGVWSLLQAATGAPDEEIVLGIQEVPSSQAMEMGQIMPDIAS